MLKTLRRIVQEVNTAENLEEALSILVKRVRKAMMTQACSLFLVDKFRQEYVLCATDGLNCEAIGKIRLKPTEGLIGVIGQREELLNLENAPTHPHFFVAPELGEERLKAFLGAPILYKRRLLGIITVQQEEKRRFDETEEAFLVTISAQLGSVIAHAEATGAISHIIDLKSASSESEDIIFTGIPGAPGICIGKVAVVYQPTDLDSIPLRKTNNVDNESKKFKQALQQTKTDIRNVKKRLKKLSPEENVLFDAYLQILNSSIESEVLLIIAGGIWAPFALQRVIERRAQQFLAMDDDYLRERAADLRDLGQRILTHLQMGQKSHKRYSKHTILAGDKINPADLAEIPAEKLAGIITKNGSINSHTAILARALNVPLVIAPESLPLVKLEGQQAIIDGIEGKIYVAPSKKTLDNFMALIEHQTQFTASLQELHQLPAQTLDGQVIALFVNSGLTADATMGLTAGAEGIGLFRTEIPFMNKDRFPGEDEQYTIYRQFLQTFAPRPVIMRTLDIGGDKNLPYFPVEEENPFLGWRGIRITLDHPEIFLAQIRAMLRANIGLDNLQIMLPMISGIQEAEDTLQLIAQAHQELQTEGYTVKMPRIGIMIEVPSAVYLAKTLAERVDFLSVGSNDLTQYLLAVDRNNARVAALYDSLHPAVLQALVHISAAAHDAGKHLSICGEMASDPLAVPLLLAMGFDALSMNATALPQIKWVIRSMNMQQAKKLLREVLALSTPAAIRKHISGVLCDLGLEELIAKKKI